MCRCHFDAASQLVSQTDALGRVTAYDYDALGRLVELTLPDPDGGGAQTSPVWTWTYDADGNTLTETNPLEETVEFSYDDLHRLILREKELVDSEYGPFLSQIETWGYDAAGNVVEAMDITGATTSFEYDHLHRLIEVTLEDPDGGGGMRPTAMTPRIS